MRIQKIAMSVQELPTFSKYKALIANSPDVNNTFVVPYHDDNAYFTVKKLVSPKRYIYLLSD